MAKAEKKAKKRVKQRNRILGSERLLPNMPFLWFTVFLAFIQTEAKKTAEEEKKICKVNIQAEIAILRNNRIDLFHTSKFIYKYIYIY